MGPFIVCKVAGIYDQRVTIEDPDGPSRKGMRACPHVVHASHLAPFDMPYVKPQEIALEGFEEIVKPVWVSAWCSKWRCCVVVEWPDIVLQAGWNKCLHLEGIERDTYHPICIQLLPLWHPRMFKGKVGLKVSRKWRSSAGNATRPSLRGSLGPGAR